MKKLLVFPLILSFLLFSCASTEEIVSSVDYGVDSIVVDTDALTVTEKPAETPVPEPVIEKESKVEEAPVEKKALETPQKKTPVVDSEEAPKEEKKDTVLTGKALVDQIREGEIKEKVQEKRGEDNTDIQTEKGSADTSSSSVIEEKDADPEKIPQIDPPIVKAQETETSTEGEKKEDTSVLDTAVDSRMISIAVEIISIMVIFALSSVIRNKYSKPLSVGLSFLLAILFTAIPMLIAFLIVGWSNLHLIYMVLIFTVFIFSSRRGH